MKRILFFLSLIFPLFIQAQNAKADTLQLLTGSLTPVAAFEAQLPTLTKYQDKADLLGFLCYNFAFKDPPKGLSYGLQGLKLSQEVDYKRGIAYCNQSMSFCLWVLGNYNEALRYALKSLRQYEEIKDYPRIGYSYLALANIYREKKDYNSGLQEAFKAIRLYDSISVPQKVAFAVTGSIYERADSLESALMYIQKAYELDVQGNEGKWGWLVHVMGNVQAKLKNYDLALAYYRKALSLAEEPKDIVDIYNNIASVHKQIGNIDSSISYSNKILQNWKSVSYQQGMLEAANNLSEIYKRKKQNDSTILYLEMSIGLNNILFTQEKEKEFQKLAFDEQVRQQEREQAALRIARERKKNLQLLAIAAFIITFMVGVIIISRKKSLLKTARFLGLLGVLLIFEFINLIAHPWIESITHHNPFLILLILVLLASVLVPAHHALEETVKKMLVKKQRVKQEKAFHTKTDTSRPESIQ
jgi:tetratricopeptide (TPR) repeat protein